MSVWSVLKDASVSEQRVYFPNGAWISVEDYRVFSSKYMNAHPAPWPDQKFADHVMNAAYEAGVVSSPDWSEDDPFDGQGFVDAL